MISLATAGPTSRTKRVVDATPSGTPRSTSGIHSCASAAAMRKSHASVSPQPPPTAWPLMAQFGEGGAQLGQHGITEGIAALGTVERDGGDEAVAGEGDVVRHGGTCITL